MGNVAEIVQLEEFLIRPDFKVIPYLGKIGYGFRLFHDKIQIVFGEIKNFGELFRVVHFGNDIFYLVLGIAPHVFGGF